MAEQNLTALLAGMNPVLDPTLYVFAHVPTRDAATRLPARMMFQEDEAWTIILPKSDADDLPTDFDCMRITLNIHSALDAVGFLAKITTRLAAHGMGVNPVAAFYHDHLFVPADRAEDAMAALNQMIAEAQSTDD